MRLLSISWRWQGWPLVSLVCGLWHLLGNPLVAGCRVYCSFSGQPVCLFASLSHSHSHMCWLTESVWGVGVGSSGRGRKNRAHSQPSIVAHTLSFAVCVCHASTAETHRHKYILFAESDDHTTFIIRSTLWRSSRRGRRQWAYAERVRE